LSFPQESGRPSRSATLRNTLGKISGVASQQIIAEHLSPQQIQLLIDFYRNRGLPPSQIDTFKATIAKAELIEAISADYIFSNSPGCVQRDAQLINSFLDSQNLPSLLDPSLE
jgi:hypothetical protein